jgi:hypothetical protein
METGHSAVPENFGTGFGGLVRSTDLIDKDGSPPVYIGDQRRLVEDTKTGLTYWVIITAAERARYIAMCPKGWGRLLKQREGGVSIEELAQQEHMETEKMRDYMAMAYGWVEQRVTHLAEVKIGLHK